MKKSVAEAMQHLNAGKRNLLVKDYANAVAELADASQLLGEAYGETAVECADAYFYYGKALLELARLESGVIQGVPDGGNDDFLDDFIGWNFVYGVFWGVYLCLRYLSQNTVHTARDTTGTPKKTPLKTLHYKRHFTQNFI